MEPGIFKSDEEKARHDKRIQLKSLNAHSGGTHQAEWFREG
jgi:hypothetical protein